MLLAFTLMEKLLITLLIWLIKKKEYIDLYKTPFDSPKGVFCINVIYTTNYQQPKTIFMFLRFIINVEVFTQ